MQQQFFTTAHFTQDAYFAFFFGYFSRACGQGRIA